MVRNLLHQAGARVACSAVSTHGNTPLLLACKAGQDGVAMTMLDWKAVACKIDERNTHNETALYWAREMKLVNVATRLLRCDGA